MALSRPQSRYKAALEASDLLHNSIRADSRMLITLWNVLTAVFRLVSFYLCGDWHVLLISSTQHERPCPPFLAIPDCSSNGKPIRPSVSPPHS